MNDTIVIIFWIVAGLGLMWAVTFATAAFMGYCTKEKEGNHHDHDT